jgi:HD-GYP domain-containing protein (c-di-GMP phosphodiesterase class II)
VYFQIPFIVVEMFNNRITIMLLFLPERSKAVLPQDKNSKELNCYFASLPLFLQQHCRMVGIYVRLFAREVLAESSAEFPLYAQGWSLSDLSRLGFYHDIGKSGIANSIWSHTGALNQEERNLVQSHTVLGARLILGKLPPFGGDSSTPTLRDTLAQCCLYHHERWDGNGYPFGLSGKTIPYFARMVGIADAFDAMTANRPYHRGIPVQDALSEIQVSAGTQFDPVLAERFCSILRQRSRQPL